MSKPIALDLKKFKHLKSDKDSTTLRHEDGHELTIAHKKLSKDMQKQLSALAALGGKGDMDQSQAEEAQSEAPQHLAKGGSAIADDSVEDSPDIAWKNAYADGGNVKKKPDPSNVDDWVSRPMDTLSQGISNVQSNMSAPAATPHKTPKSPGHDSMDYACGGPVKMAEGGMPDEDAMQHPTAPADLMSVNPDAVNKQEAIGKQLEQGAKDNTGLQSNKDVYNWMVTSAGGDPKAMFGPNGELPAGQVNPDIWAQAKIAPDATRASINQMRMGYQDHQVQQQQAEHDKLQAQNAVNAEIGAPPVLTPGAPELKTAPDMPVGNKLPQTPGEQPMSQTGSDPRDPESMLIGGYNKQIAGINAGAKAQGDLGQQQAALFQQQQAVQQQTQDHYQQAYDGLNKERVALMEDIKNGYVDPDQYWKGTKDPITGETHGGHSKVMAGIGILLGGLNQGANGTNPALQNLQFQMDKNIEAQSKNLQSKDNLLGHNIRQFGNLKDGIMMTRIMQNDMLQSKISEAAAKASSPMAKAAAQQAIGQLQQQTAPMFQQFAMRRAMMNLANNSSTQPGAVEHMLGYMRVMNPEMAKEMETRVVPSIGPNGSSAVATIPVPTEVRTKLVGFENIDKLSKDLLNFTKHNSTIIPGTAAYNVGAQKAMTLQSAIREGQLGTVYKAGEQPLLDKFMSSNPAGALKEYNTNPGLRNLIQTNLMQGNILRRNYGLPQSQPTQQGQTTAEIAPQALAWAKANPKDPRAAQILQRLGGKK